MQEAELALLEEENRSLSLSNQRLAAERDSLWRVADTIRFHLRREDYKERRAVSQMIDALDEVCNFRQQWDGFEE